MHVRHTEKRQKKRTEERRSRKRRELTIDSSEAAAWHDSWSRSLRQESSPHERRNRQWETKETGRGLESSTGDTAKTMTSKKHAKSSHRHPDVFIRLPPRSAREIEISTERRGNSVASRIPSFAGSSFTILCTMLLFTLYKQSRGRCVARSFCRNYAQHIFLYFFISYALQIAT